MISKLIYNYVDCLFNYEATKIKLPEEIKLEISRCWQQHLLTKRSVNGQLFTIDSIKLNDNILSLYVKSTSYDHYIYSFKNNFNGKYICRSLASNVLPLTSDNYYVLAVMSEWTSLANKIKFIGGALSKDDINDKILEPLTCIQRETYEEIGIKLNDKSQIKKIRPLYFITRKNMSFINVLFSADLALSSNDVSKLFEQYKTNLENGNKEVELRSLIFIKNEKDKIKDFICSNRDRLIEYMEEVFCVLNGELEANDILKKEECQLNNEAKEKVELQ